MIADCSKSITTQTSFLDAIEIARRSAQIHFPRLVRPEWLNGVKFEIVIVDKDEIASIDSSRNFNTEIHGDFYCAGYFKYPDWLYGMLYRREKPSRIASLGAYAILQSSKLDYSVGCAERFIHLSDSNQFEWTSMPFQNSIPFNSTFAQDFTNDTRNSFYARLP